MDALVDRVAGLDIGKAIVVACVRAPGPRAAHASAVFGTVSVEVHRSHGVPALYQKFTAARTMTAARPDTTEWLHWDFL